MSETLDRWSADRKALLQEGWERGLSVRVICGQVNRMIGPEIRESAIKEAARRFGFRRPEGVRAPHIARQVSQEARNWLIFDDSGVVGPVETDGTTVVAWGRGQGVVMGEGETERAYVGRVNVLRDRFGLPRFAVRRRPVVEMRQISVWREALRG